MAKTILKVVYVTIAAVLAFVLYLGFYSSFRTDYVVNMAKTAVQNKDYVTIDKMFNVTFDSKSILNSQASDKVYVEVLPSISRLDVSTYTKNDDDSYKANDSTYLFEYNYSFYFYEIDFSLSDRSDNGKTLNNTSIRFYNDDNKYYDYYFRITSSVNSELYTMYPLSVSEGLLNTSRDMVYTYNYVNLCYATFNETILNIISNDYLDGKSITKYTLVDSNGSEVFTPSEIDLSFNQQFFKETEIITFKEKYNAYLSASDDEKDTRLTEFENWYYGENKDGVFYTFYETTAHPTYMHQFDESVLTPSSIIWKSIGLLALYILAVVILYILIFKFKWIKSIVTRKKANEGQYSAKDSAKKKNSIDAKVNDTSNK